MKFLEGKECVMALHYTYICIHMICTCVFEINTIEKKKTKKKIWGQDAVLLLWLKSYLHIHFVDQYEIYTISRIKTEENKPFT